MLVYDRRQLIKSQNAIVISRMGPDHLILHGDMTVS